VQDSATLQSNKKLAVEAREEAKRQGLEGLDATKFTVVLTHYYIYLTHLSNTLTL
jgi:hypothetical protein